MAEWYARRETLVEVASFGYETGELREAADILYFLEKPWKYEELYEAWTSALVETS